MNQINALEYLVKVPETELKKLIAETGISLSSVNSLYKKELLRIKEIRHNSDSEEIFSEEFKNISLNEDQLTALNRINICAEENSFKAYA